SAACVAPSNAQPVYMNAQMTRYRDQVWDRTFDVAQNRHQIPVALRASAGNSLDPLLDPAGVWIFSTGTAADADPLSGLDVYAISKIRTPTLQSPPQPPL